MREMRKVKAQQVRELESLREELKQLRQAEQGEDVPWKEADFSKNPFVRVLNGLCCSLVRVCSQHGYSYRMEAEFLSGGVGERWQKF